LICGQLQEAEPVTSYDLIVVGGGPAGVTAALRARELGASVALVERGRMGGTCTNDGCAPTRVLARAARLVRDADDFDSFGLTGVRPGVDLPALLARTQERIERLHEKKQLIRHLEESGAQVFAEAGDARFRDAHTIETAHGPTLAGAWVLLCAGGRARRLPIPGAELAITHSDVWRLPRQPRSIAIVGAAATGCQLATIFAAFGTRVTLLEVAPRILAAEDEDVARAMHDALERRGVTVDAGIGGLERVERAGDGLRAYYKRGDEAGVAEAEAVLLAVGWQGNLDTLNLEAAGVASARGYVTVDEQLRTSAEHIYAAGDITGRMMLVQSATYQARIAVENALLGAGRPYAPGIVPRGSFTDPEYAGVGVTEGQAQGGEPFAVATVPYAELDRAVIDGHTEGFFKLIVAREGGRVLGAHAVGEQAVEVVQTVAAGMAAGVSAPQLAELELAYPTYAAIVGVAARQIVRDLGITPVSPAWRAMRRPAAEWETKG
jgi:pyruvate/2-oxoglutarate dehydrogenase complex dihydrolipoamide dehydrogenase (E3) component